MKNLFLVLTITTAQTITAQNVGINTVSPTRTLDVNGNLRIRTLSDKTSDTSYNKVLVVDPANGEVEHFDRTALTNASKSIYVENKKSIQISSTPDPSKTVPCGRYKFRFNNTTPPQPQIQQSDSTDQPYNVIFNLIRKQHENAKSTFFTKTVNISGGDVWTDLQSGFALDTVLDEYYITHPTDANLYRVTFQARKSGGTNYTYTVMCEKF